MTQHTTNTANDEVGNLVERWAELERAKAEALAEHKDAVKDMKSEIKSASDRTGKDVKEIEALVKIRLAETEARDELSTAEENLAVYDVIFATKDRKAAAEIDEDEV